MHTNSTRDQRATGSKTVANVVRTKPITETEVRHRFAPTLSDWSEREQAVFAKAVAASHGWNYHNAMAVMAIQWRG